MDLFKLFPTPVASIVDLDISLEDLEIFKTYILTQKTSNITPIITENQKILEHSIFTNLKKYILTYSKQYLTCIGHLFEDLQISTSWGTITPPDKSSNSHTHSNSYISGVYYLTQDSEIAFYDPTSNLYSFQSEKSEIANEDKYTSFIIKMFPNSLLLFPSFLSHSILPYQGNSKRISIAFNIIPKGEFGKVGGKLYL